MKPEKIQVTEKELRGTIKNARCLVGKIHKNGDKHWQFLILQNSFIGITKTKFLYTHTYEYALLARKTVIAENALRILGLSWGEIYYGINNLRPISNCSVRDLVRSVVRGI